MNGFRVYLRPTNVRPEYKQWVFLPPVRVNSLEERHAIANYYPIEILYACMPALFDYWCQCCYEESLTLEVRWLNVHIPESEAEKEARDAKTRAGAARAEEIWPELRALRERRRL